MHSSPLKINRGGIGRLLFAPVALAALSACQAPEAVAPQQNAKRTVLVRPATTQFIELEDGSRYGVGENLYNRLVTLLQNDPRFVVVVDESELIAPSEAPKSLIRGLVDSVFEPSDRLRFNFPPLLDAEYRFSVEGLSFLHGSRALRNYSGFQPDFRTHWNSGALESRNEFPQRTLIDQRSWFGTHFDPIGSVNNNSITGVEAGAEGEMNLLIAKFHYRRDKFEGAAQIDTYLNLRDENLIRKQRIEAAGSGFLFAFGIGIAQLELEFGVARRDALKKTFDEAARLIALNAQTELATMPFRTRIEDLGAEGIILHAGRREGVLVGDRLQAINAGGALVAGGAVLEITEVFARGSVAKVISSNAPLSKLDRFQLLDRSTMPAAEKLLAMAAASPTKNSRRFTSNANAVALPGPALSSGLNIPSGTNNLVELEPKRITFDPPEISLPSGEANRALSLKSTILLPFLLWRYAQYDQEAKPLAEVARPLEDTRALEAVANASSAHQALGTVDAWRNSRLSVAGRGIRVGIIDSGVDYNHRSLAAATPRTRLGWDFFGGDARPFDDNSHGSAIAGIIASSGAGGDPVGVAPGAEIISYRVFNPYGETRSMHLAGALERAVRDGCRIIVLAWDTELESQALVSRVRWARDQGVLIIVAAGDRGRDLRTRPSYPAVLGSEPGILTVAALDTSGALTRIAGRSSNFDPTSVELAAPGFNQRVLSPRNETLTRAGSDLAAAYAAGVAALVWSTQPALRSLEVEAILLLGATIVPNLQGQVSGGRVLSASGAIRARP